MLRNPNLSAAAKTLEPKITDEELESLRAECREYITQGGERGVIAAEILRINDAFDRLSSEIEPLLKR